MEEIAQFNVPGFSEEQTPMTVKSTLKICVCCLLENVPLIKLSVCKHAELFDFFFKLKLEYSESMVCYGCHKFLKDFYLFKQQVKNSCMWLNNQVQEKPNHVKLKEITQSHIELTYTHNSEPIQNEILQPAIAIYSPTHIIKTEVKIELDYSDPENDMPLSEVKQKNEIIKKDAPVKNYEGKVRSVFLSEEEMMEDRMKEAAKEGYLNLPYKCESCITGFDHELTLKEHMEKRHYETDSGFVCKVCKSVLSSAASYKEHTRRHYKRIECVECGVRYNTVQSVVTHYSKTHSQIDTSYECKDCDYTTTDDSDVDDTTPEIEEAAQATLDNLLPEKSKAKYLKVYRNFTAWCNKKNTTSFSENVLLAYFGELSKTLKPSTLWLFYSMLKATISLKHNIDLKRYTRLIKLLKKYSKGYKSKKSETLTAENVDTFLRQAPDLVYLAAKVLGPCATTAPREMWPLWAIMSQLSGEKSHRRYRYHCAKHKEKPCCPSCGKSFVNNSALKMHMFTVHKVSNRVYSCPQCDKVYNARSGLLAHTASVHRAAGAYCAPCRAHFRTPHNLRHHLSTHSRHASDKDKKFECSVCGERFLTKTRLRDHVDWDHLKSANHKCDECGKVFKNSVGLKRHLSYVHEKKRPPRDKICDYCGRGFTTLAILRAHIRTHTGARPLRCAHCDASFAHSAALHNHAKLHKDAR